MPSVSAVVVAFHPAIERLAANLDALCAEASRTVVYDNSDAPEACGAVRAACAARGVAYLGGSGNVGVATAQNRAVAALGAAAPDDAVIFLDQDSRVPGGLVTALHGSLAELRSLDPLAGALGATPVDAHGRVYPTRARGALGPYVWTDFVISSGSIVGLADLRAIGGFRDDLFIDLVDNELCWRFRRAGRRCYVDPRITFQHAVGTGRTVVALGKRSPVSQPFRNYYQVRNLLLVGRARVLPWRTVAVRLAMRLGAILLSGVTSGQACARLRFATRGLRDGLRGQGGRLR